MIQCPECQEPMTSARENHLYTESGLPNVTLVGVEVRRCPACGEQEVVIPRLDELHRALAWAVIGKKSRLSGPEVRFLRTNLGWSGAEFARHLGVAPETVSRWENDKERTNALADRLVRLMIVTKTPPDDYSLDALVDLEEKPTPLKLRVESKRGGWAASHASNG